ncbi:hypothetical protein [Vulcanisaeta moutnovskia]|uniref:hypothetical protein n=1 Tax=Vulcanisaeta moutnovskia TaxID=985052 RepID=UPI00064F7436|nr:hypothetical protein [Vulcanisaeta moutnovskia]
MGIKTDKHDLIRASKYVFTTGVWASKYLPMLNLPIRIIIKRIIRVRINHAVLDVFYYLYNYYMRPEGVLRSLNEDALPTRKYMGRPRHL